MSKNNLNKVRQELDELLNFLQPYVTKKEKGIVFLSEKMKYNLEYFQSLMKNTLLSSIPSNNNNYNNYNNNNNIFRFRVLTLNILADEYGHPKQYPYCPFNTLQWNHRRTHLLSFLHTCKSELIALQEVDHPNDITNALSDTYHFHYMQRSRKKSDGCLLLWSKQHFKLYNMNKSILYSNPMNIEFNDLADACLSGNMQNHYRRDNVASIVALQTKPEHLLIFCTCHLYYHWLKEDVKLRQCAYMVNIVHDMASEIAHSDPNIKNISILITGDFNATPETGAYEYMTNGVHTMKAHSNEELKLIMDPSLNKLARWMRAIGVDTIFFDPSNVNNDFFEPEAKIQNEEQDKQQQQQQQQQDEKEEKKTNNFKSKSMSSISKRSISKPSKNVQITRIDDDSKDNNESFSSSKKQFSKSQVTLSRDYEKLFNAASDESRYLITKSKRLSARKNCPPHVLLKSSDMMQNLEFLIKYFGLSYDEKALYTRCSLCNGSFRDIAAEEVNDCAGIPQGLKHSVDTDGRTLKFYECVKCKQVYWWGNKTQKEAERFEKIFSEITKQEEKKQQEDTQKHPLSRCLPSLQTYFWKDIIFRNPFQKGFKCNLNVNCHSQNNEYQFTNKTGGFEGILDYIFYTNFNTQFDDLTCIDARIMLPDDGLSPYPNLNWFSDHLPIMAIFELKSAH